MKTFILDGETFLGIHQDLDFQYSKLNPSEKFRTWLIKRELLISGVTIIKGESAHDIRIFIPKTGNSTLLLLEFLSDSKLSLQETIKHEDYFEIKIYPAIEIYLNLKYYIDNN